MDQQTASEWLRYCLGPGADEIRVTRLERLSASDWDRVIQQATRHGLAPLLYRRLSTTGSGSTIPASVMQGLREIYLHSAGSRIRQEYQLSKVLTVLQDDDIPAIVLKGPHLAEVVYGDPALRPMSDVDLLVRKTDLARVEEELLELGYGSSRRFRIEVESAMHHHLPTFTKPGAVPVEIHWTVAHPTAPFNIDVDGLWHRARPATIAGVKTLVLAPEDLLLHLCLHISFHDRFTVGLKPFCDIAETLRYYRGEMDWEQVQLRARQWGASKCVYLTLYLTRELLAVPVPDEVLSALEPKDLEPKFVIWARERIFTERGDSRPVAPDLVRIWEAKRLQDKVATLLKLAFPAPHPAVPVSKQIYLYYLIRLKDLLLRHGRTAWQLLRHDEEMIASAEREDRANALIDWLVSA